MSRTKIELSTYVVINALQKIADLLANSVITIFLLSKNISYVKIGILWSVYLSSLMIFDLSSGAIADLIGRRKTYVVGVILSILSYILLILGYSFNILVISYVTKGLGAALMSGCLPAWLGSKYESSIFKNYTGKTKLIEVILTLPIITFIIMLNINESFFVLYIVIFIQIIIALLSTIFMRDNKGEVDSIFKLTVSGVKDVFCNYNLIISLMMSIFSFVAFSAFNLIWQPYGSELGIAIKYFPILNGIYISISSIISYLTSKLNLKSIILNNLSMILYLLSFSMMILLSNHKSFLALMLFMCLFAFASGISFISISCGINENSTNRNKATVFSVVSSVSSLSAVVFQPLVAYWMGKDVKMFFMKISLLLLILFIVCNFYFRIFNAKKGKHV